MDKAVQTWFNNYYGKCLGASTPIKQLNGESDESQIAAEYSEKFLLPMCYIATGQKLMPDDKSVLNRSLNVISTGPITDWIYLLRYWVEEGFFTYTGDLQGDFNKCVTRTRQEMRIVFATAGKDCRDICLHTVDRKTVDDLPCDVFYYPRDAKAHFNGKLLADTCAKNPTMLTDTEIAMLSAAEARGYISVSDLRTEDVMVPYDHGKQQKFVTMNALTPNRPPAAYLELCRNLAPAQAQQFPTLFLAVQDYAKSVTVPDAVRTYINIIAGSEDLFAEAANSVPAKTLDDSMVMEYLRENYGLVCTGLNELSVNTRDVFKSAVAVDEALLEGSAKELMEAVTGSDEVIADSLDNIIIRFCEDNKLSQQCTIEQLIQVINYDVHPTPPTFLDQVATYMSENDASPETTFDDVIKGQKHKFKDPIDTVIDFVQTNEFYTDDLRKVLLNSIIEGEPVVLPTEKEVLLSSLPKLGLNDDLLSRIMIAVQTDSQVELPKQEEVPKGSDLPETEDKGFKAGYYLLKTARDSICEDASPNNRMKFQPVLYSFLRLMMCDPNSELDEVAESIATRVKSAQSPVKEALEESIAILRS